MKLPLLTTIAMNMAVAFASSSKEDRGMIRGFVPKPELDFPHQLRKFQNEVKDGIFEGSPDNPDDPCEAPSSNDSKKECEEYCADGGYNEYTLDSADTGDGSDDDTCICYKESGEKPKTNKSYKTCQTQPSRDVEEEE